MYSYSHHHSGPWLAQYDKPQDALIGGRAAFGSDHAIYVGLTERAHFSDLFIGAAALLSYMTEDAVEKHGMDFGDPFQMLETGDFAKLDVFLVDAIGEWESELSAAKTFTGDIIKEVIRYRPDAQVRPGHFK